jgi:hypothetical protein
MPPNPRTEIRVLLDVLIEFVFGPTPPPNQVEADVLTRFSKLVERPDQS